jgi:tRNA dimethylallyltransferase
MDAAGALLRRCVVGWLAGPTAAGKSEIALSLAARRGWAILSVDSRQIYRGLDVGTAKPTPAERARVEHLLVDVLDPREACSAGRFRALALEALAPLDARGRRVLAVGGAGLYWEALVRPLHPLPPADPERRAAHAEIIEREGLAALHRRLAAVDPITAGRLAPEDRQRVSRALEVYESSGRPLSEWLGQARAGRVPLPVAALVPERAELERRIAARVEAMLRGGLLAEIARLLESGVPPAAPGLRSVGYREFLPHLLEDAPLAACRARFLEHTRQYAKRQLTWLRGRVPEHLRIDWAAGEPAAAAEVRVERALAGEPRGGA